MVDGVLMRRLSNAANNNNEGMEDKSAWAAYENQSHSSTSALTDESLSSHMTISERSGSLTASGEGSSFSVSSSSKKKVKKSFSQCIEAYNNSNISHKKPTSKKSSDTPRRRSSVSGGTATSRSTIGEQKCEEKPTKPRSLRRRSLFGSTTGDEGNHHHHRHQQQQKEEKPKQRTSRRRRSLLGESTSATESDITTTESVDSRNTTSTQEKHAADNENEEQPLDHVATPTKPASSRRRGSLNLLFGSSHESSSDDVNKKSKPTKKSSFGSNSRQPRRNSLDMAHIHTDHDIPRSPQKPPSSRRRGSLNLFTTSAEEQRPDDIEEPKKPSSRRRGSFNLFTTTSGDQQPEKIKARRRLSLTKNSFRPGEVYVEEEKEKEKEKAKTKTKKKKNSDDSGDGKQHKRGSFRRLSLGRSTSCSSSSSVDQHRLPPTDQQQQQQQPRSSSRPRRNSLSGSTHSVSSVENNINVHEYIAELRGDHGLQKFSRNMLMDTIAKQVSRDLAASKGTTCTPTNYYGNVGQGETVKHILDTMTTRKGTAQDNILNPYFKEFGLGMTKGKDGLIYMCQVFK